MLPGDDASPIPTPGDALEHQQLEHSKLLLVEGTDESAFFGLLLRALGLEQTIGVQLYEGKSRLRAKLRTLHISPNFDRVQSIGITGDADSTPTSIFLSMQASLQTAGLPVPTMLNQVTGNQPIVSVYLLPDCTNTGMLEDLILGSLQADTVIDCVNEYFNCIGPKILVPLRWPSKARLQVYLASRQECRVGVALAAAKGYIDVTHPIFDDIKAFLSRL